MLRIVHVGFSLLLLLTYAQDKNFFFETYGSQFKVESLSMGVLQQTHLKKGYSAASVF